MSDASAMIQKNVELPIQDVQRFNSLYPQTGAWSWFFRKALRNFLDLHDTTSDDLVDQAVREINLLDAKV